ncbi:MAG: hypothetical protein JNJ60_13275 [Rhodocyclaceae bacterium]|nr:hypothetical protein [Rhodocyclaceae bacterium]
MFTGNQAPAQSKRRATRAQNEDDFMDWVDAELPQAPPKAVLNCPQTWGQEEEADDVDVLLDPTSTKHEKIEASEQLGETGAIYLLQKVLYDNGVHYDDDNLRVFHGANTFNIVYSHPNVKNPTRIIVLEGKGGSSQCGSRTDPRNGKTVWQGTQKYLDAEAYVMSCSSDADKRRAGQNIAKLMQKNQGAVQYVGVRAPYNAKRGEAYDPEVIFSMSV